MDKYPEMQGTGSEFIFFPEGRYEQYEKKLQKIIDARDYVLKHKIAFSLLALLLIGILLAFTICRGIFIGGIECSDLTYGDSFSPCANAFFCRVDYEYSSDGKTWSFEEPSLPGVYRVRGVSVNPFGMERRSPSTSFTLSPKPARISLLECSIEYGYDTDTELDELFTPDKNIDAVGIVQGDRILELDVSFHRDDWSLITADAPRVTIVNKDGRGVTASYDLTLDGTLISVFPRRITVKTESAEKIYDALPWNDAKYAVTSGSLRETDSLVISFPTFSAEPATYTVAPEVLRIVDENGEDITHRYNITLDAGSFTVKRIPLVFSTPDAKKTYDGLPLSAPEWTFESGELRPNHKYEARSDEISITNVGTKKNTVTVTLTDDVGQDVSAYYQLIFNEGSLTIDPIILKFETASNEKVYDGTPLTAAGYDWISGELLDGHTANSIRTIGTITNAGSSNNTLEVIIKDKNNQNVTSLGYKIEVEEGQLWIKPRPITVTSESAEKVFNGTPLRHEVASVTKGELVPNQFISFSFTGEQTEIGESENTFTVERIYSTVTGFAATTENYSITYEYGTLRVLPNNNTGDGTGGVGTGGVGTGGVGTGSFPNTDFNMGGTKIEVPPQIDPNDIPVMAEILARDVGKNPFWMYLRAGSFGDYNGSGFEAAQKYTGSSTSPLDYIGLIYKDRRISASNVNIKRFEGCPTIMPYYTHNTEIFGPINDVVVETAATEYYVSFYKRMLNTVLKDRSYGDTWDSDRAKYENFVYNTYLQIPESTKSALLEMTGYLIKPSSSKIDVINAIKDYVANSAVYNLEAEPYPEGVDVAVYFLSTAKEGICQHYAAAATMLYRAYGIPARYTVGFAVLTTPEKETSVTALNAHAWVEIYLDGKGWVPIEVTGEGSPMQPGKKKITVTSYSITKEYDGRLVAYLPGEKFVISSGSLYPGHTIDVVVANPPANAVMEVGEYENTITSVKIYDSSGNDVTESMYEIKLNHGSTVISRRKITLLLGSATKVYDGYPLVCAKWSLLSGSLLSGHNISLYDLATPIEVGQYNNTAKVSVTTDVTVLNPELGVDLPGHEGVYLPFDPITSFTRNVTDYYEITVIYGTLEILPAP